MPSYKTLAQILIATSVASSALTAPIIIDEPKPNTPSDTSSTVVDPPSIKAPMKAPSVWRTAPIMGLIAGGVAALGGLLQKGINTVAPSYNYQNGTFQRSVEETDLISRGLAGLSDEHLLSLRDISRQALESLD